MGLNRKFPWNLENWNCFVWKRRRKEAKRLSPIFHMVHKCIGKLCRIDTIFPRWALPLANRGISVGLVYSKGMGGLSYGANVSIIQAPVGDAEKGGAAVKLMWENCKCKSLQFHISPLPSGPDHPVCRESTICDGWENMAMIAKHICIYWRIMVRYKTPCWGFSPVLSHKLISV